MLTRSHYSPGPAVGHNAGMDLLFPAYRPQLTDEDLLKLYAWPEHPFLRANMVSTVDGMVRGPDDRSESISSGADKRVFHMLRGTCDAVIVGAGTVRTENYRALPAHRKWQQWQSHQRQDSHRITPIVVVSNRGEFAPTARLFDSPPGAVIVAVPDSVATRVRQDLPANVEVVACGSSTVELPELLTLLIDRKHTRLLTEGGPSLLAALWPQVAELCLTTSPHVLGASGGITRPSPDLFGGQQLGPNASSAVTLRHLILADGSLLASWQRQPDSSLMGT